MAEPNEPKNPSLRDVNAYVDENGQNMGQDSPLEVANPANLQRHLARDVGAESEIARLASGRPNQDATEATEAEVPAETIAKISDPSRRPETSEAVDRATSGLGKED